MSEKQHRSDADAVLSSVRRLVTQHAPFADPMKRDGDDAPAKDAASDVWTQPEPAEPARSEPEGGDGMVAEERLLLTPALRIAGGRDHDLEDRVDTTDAEIDAQYESRKSALEERIAELELAVSGHPGEWEPDGSEDQDAETPDAMAYPSSSAFLHEEEEDVVPFGSFESPDADATPEKEAAPDLAESIEVELAPEPPAAVIAIAERGGNIELPMNDSAEADDPDRDIDTASAIEDADVEAIIDEAALRDLVSEIVREELQGDLGERITRNIRRLVRREIHRAIMTRDFS